MISRAARILDKSRRLAAIFALRFFYLVSSFLIASILAKQLSQKDFGIYTIAYSILLLVYSISISGVPTLLIREVSVAIDGARKDELPMLMSNAILWTLAVCLMLAFVAASYFYLAPSKKPVFEDRKSVV